MCEEHLFLPFRVRVSPFFRADARRADTRNTVCDTRASESVSDVWFSASFNVGYGDVIANALCGSVSVPVDGRSKYLRQ